MYIGVFRVVGNIFVRVFSGCLVGFFCLGILIIQEKNTKENRNRVGSLYVIKARWTWILHIVIYTSCIYMYNYNTPWNNNGFLKPLTMLPKSSVYSNYCYLFTIDKLPFLKNIIFYLYKNVGVL